MSASPLTPKEAVYFLFDSFHFSKKNAFLLLDVGGEVLHISSSFTRNFGYFPDDITGQNFRILFTAESRRCGAPESELRKVLTTGQAGDNNELVCKDGSVIWVSGESVLWEFQGQKFIVKILQDIHKFKVKQIESDYLKNFNESILSSIEDAVLIIDESRNIIKYNHYFRLLFGRNEPVLNYDGLLNLIDDKNSCEQLHRMITATILHHREFKNFEVKITDESGIGRHFEIAAKPMETAEGEKTVLIILHNISLMKELQMQTEDVLGFVAHELRNPITNLMVTCHLMDSYLKSGKWQKAIPMLAKANGNVTRINRLVSDLNNASKIRGHKIQLEMASFFADEVVHDALETIEGLHPGYTIHVTGHAHKIMRGDKFRLIQVVTNYLSNAIKYSDKEKVIDLHMEVNGFFKVSITDFGIGIAEEALPFIFSRFYRTNASRAVEGIGLGLYLVKRIVEAHQGSVYVESTEGLGSTFTFEVPVNTTGE